MTLKYLASSIAAAALSLGIAHAATTTINAGGSSLAAPTYIQMFKTYTAANPTILFSYEAVGSGGGQKAFLNNDITQFEAPNVTSGTLTYGTIVGTQVDIGASDAFLSASQLTNPATGSYAESSVDGPLIQIPTIGTPITIPYNESHETGTLTLTDAQVCGVLSAKITDWHTLVSTIPAGTIIKVVYRSDSSGTTFLLTQHLDKVCNSTNSNFTTAELSAPTKTFAATLFPSGVPASFIGESGSLAVATELLTLANGISYLSPDYTSIAPGTITQDPNKTTLKVASLVNASNGTAYQPTVANTETALAHAGAGSTDPTPPNTLAKAMNPLNWVPALPLVTSGYPIVGYTTVELSSCYANKTAGSAIVSFLATSYTSSTYTSIITNNGFVPLTNSAASPYATSIAEIFLSNLSGYKLNIDNATVCASYTGR